MCTLKNSNKAQEIRPKSAWLTVNRGCNFRCLGCYAQGTGYDKSHDMSLELAEQITRLVQSVGIKGITIIGGEPTLWEHLIPFNSLCKKLNIKTTIVTNAMKFSDDVFWEKYKNNPNTKAGISIKAFDNKSLKEFAKVNSFEFSKIGIKRGVEFFRCGVSTVYDISHSNTLIDIAQFSMDCGANHLNISPCTPAFCNGVPDGTYVIHPNIIVQNILNMYQRLDEVTNGHISFSIKLPLCIWPRDFIEMLIKKNQIRTVCQLHHREGLIFDTAGKLAVCNSLFDYTIGKFGVDFSDDESLLSTVNSPGVLGLYNRPLSKVSLC